MMRIITGTARGIKLATLEGDATRPTSERAKEAVFSMIQFDIEGRNVLDLYAGSGQMGLEALSRGAKNATFVDSSRAATDIIAANAKKTHLDASSRIITADCNGFISRLNEKFDLVFIDPPYALHAVAGALEGLLEKGALKSTSTIVCESSEEDIFEMKPELASKFNVLRRAKYGVAYITVLNPKGDL